VRCIRTDLEPNNGKEQYPIRRGNTNDDQERNAKQHPNSHKRTTATHPETSTIAHGTNYWLNNYRNNQPEEDNGPDRRALNFASNKIRNHGRQHLDV
jgi:hypothetical protein